MPKFVFYIVLGRWPPSLLSHNSQCLTCKNLHIKVTTDRFAEPQFAVCSVWKFAHQFNIRMTRSHCYWVEEVMTTRFDGVGVYFVWNRMTAHIVHLQWKWPRKPVNFASVCTCLDFLFLLNTPNRRDSLLESHSRCSCDLRCPWPADQDDHHPT